MIDAMEEASANRKLTNTDGDPLVLVNDRYALAATDARAVRAAIAAIDGAAEESDDSVTILRGDTVVARIAFSAARVDCETNSLRRADAARQRLESACDGMIRFVVRDITDPLSPAARKGAAALPASETSPQELSALREWKQAYYAKWLDESLPALNGMTPREAAIASPRGRERVEALLRDIEYLEAKRPAAERVDVSSLRRQLRLE